MIAKNKKASSIPLFKQIKTSLDEQAKNGKVESVKQSARVFHRTKYEAFQKFRQSSSPPQPKPRANSNIKKVFLDKNQFALQKVDFSKKIKQCLKLFQPMQAKFNVGRQSVAESVNKDSSLIETNLNSLGLKKQSARPTHTRSSSWVPSNQRESNCCGSSQQAFVLAVNALFREIQIIFSEWKKNYVPDEAEGSFRELIHNFKGLFDSLHRNYCQKIIRICSFLESQMLQCMKQYEEQIYLYKQQCQEAKNVRRQVKTLKQLLVEQHRRGVLTSQLLQQIQKSQKLDLQDFFRSCSSSLEKDQPTFTAMPQVGSFPKHQALQADYCKIQLQKQRKKHSEEKSFEKTSVLPNKQLSENWSIKGESNDEVLGKYQLNLQPCNQRQERPSKGYSNRANIKPTNKNPTTTNLININQVFSSRSKGN